LNTRPRSYEPSGPAHIMIGQACLVLQSLFPATSFTFDKSVLYAIGQLSEAGASYSPNFVWSPWKSGVVAQFGCAIVRNQVFSFEALPQSWWGRMDKVALSDIGRAVLDSATGSGILSTRGCPCGYFGSSSRRCTCNEFQIQRYVSKVSGPLMDRIDIHVDVPAVKFEELRGKNVPVCDTSEEIRVRVIRARDIQLKRFEGDGVFSNSAMSPKQIRIFCPLDSECEALLENAMTRQGLSARAHDRILKVSRTIADLESSERIRGPHISEAIGYRSLDRNYWV